MFRLRLCHDRTERNKVLKSYFESGHLSNVVDVTPSMSRKGLPNEHCDSFGNFELTLQISDFPFGFPLNPQHRYPRKMTDSQSVKFSSAPTRSGFHLVSVQAVPKQMSSNLLTPPPRSLKHGGQVLVGLAWVCSKPSSYMLTMTQNPNALFSVYPRRRFPPSAPPVLVKGKWEATFYQPNHQAEGC